MDVALSHNQKAALIEISNVVDRNIMSATEVPTFREAKELLQSKKYDYCGQPVEHMEDLVATKVIPTWPKIGEAGVRCITEFLDGDALEAMKDPWKWVLPYDKQPPRSKRSRVRATDDEWFRICKAGYERGMLTIVEDKDIPKDKRCRSCTKMEEDWW